MRTCYARGLFKHSNRGLITKGTIGSPVWKRPPFAKRVQNIWEVLRKEEQWEDPVCRCTCTSQWLLEIIHKTLCGCSDDQQWSTSTCPAQWEQLIGSTRLNQTFTVIRISESSSYAQLLWSFLYSVQCTPPPPMKKRGKKTIKLICLLCCVWIHSVLYLCRSNGDMTLSCGELFSVTNLKTSTLIPRRYYPFPKRFKTWVSWCLWFGRFLCQCHLTSTLLWGSFVWYRATSSSVSDGRHQSNAPRKCRWWTKQEFMFSSPCSSSAKRPAFDEKRSVKISRNTRIVENGWWVH